MGQILSGVIAPLGLAFCGGTDLNILQKLKVLISCHPDDLKIGGQI